jgi:multiple sugar transport system substrate-binding protein
MLASFASSLGSLGIPANSAAADEAWTFVKWATSAKAQKAMALYTKYGYQFSDFARRSLYKDPDLLKIYPYLPGQLVGLEAGNGKISRPGAPTYTTLESIYGLNPQQRHRRDESEDCAANRISVITRRATS